MVSQVGGTPNLYLYSGEQNDPSLRLYYFRSRYLGQTTGRFLSADTIQGNIDEPLTENSYLYAQASPVDRIDPSGHLRVSMELAEGGEAAGF